MTEALQCPNCEGAERWYWRKHAFIKASARRFGKDIEQAFAVYAVLSTNATVAENDKNFLRWCRDEEIGHFGSVLARVSAASSGDIAAALAYKKGRKIVSFHENLRFPWRRFSVPTIDRHAATIVTGDRRLAKNWLARKHGYMGIAKVYMNQAEALGWRPHEWQARSWVHHVLCNERKVA